MDEKKIEELLPGELLDLDFEMVLRSSQVQFKEMTNLSNNLALFLGKVFSCEIELIENNTYSKVLSKGNILRSISSKFHFISK